MSTPGQNDALKRWKDLCETIQAMSTVDESESNSDRLKRIEKARKDFSFFVTYYFPHYCTDATTGEVIQPAPFHIDAAKDILHDKILKAVYEWARGHAKSTYIDIMIPMWLKCQKKRELNFMVLVSKSEDMADRLLGDLQAEFKSNKRYIRDFGNQYNAGMWTEGEFSTIDGATFIACGRGQSPRGLRNRNFRPDYIAIDDLDDDELCRNKERVEEATRWVEEALFGTFGAQGGRFIMVGNLISKNSVLANIAAKKSVKVSQINVRDKNGKPSWPQLWTDERIRAKEEFMGYRGFQKEYMNNPIITGAVYKQEWIRYKKMLPLKKYDELIAYCDPSFKGSSKSDYKAIKLWGKIGTELHHIRAFVRQCSIGEMVRWFYDLHESMPEDVICKYMMEANFLQDLILDEFTAEGNLRGYQLPIAPDTRKKPDKYQRIEAISSLWERGFVFYNIDLKDDPDTLAALDQTLAFEKGSRAHDDAPDADEGAIYKLQKTARTEAFEPRFAKRQSTNTW